MSVRHLTCTYCNESYKLGPTSCPHCGRPGVYANVEIANSPDEVHALEQRFATTIQNAKSRGITDLANRFLKHMDRSKAVINCTPGKLLSTVEGTVDVLAVFQQLEELRCSANPDGENWGLLRATAEQGILESMDHVHKVHYASLTLNSFGLKSYGCVALTLKDGMIISRSTVFPENSALYYENRRQGPPELGMRVSWGSRAKACFVKHEPDLDPLGPDSEFDNLILRNGFKADGRTPDPRQDIVIEVHILGSITFKSIERVVYLREPTNFLGQMWKLLHLKSDSDFNATYSKRTREYCEKLGVPFEELTNA